MTDDDSAGLESPVTIDVAHTNDRLVTDGGRDSISDDLTRFQIDLLVAAARLDGASGQDLKRRVADAWGVDEEAINHGRLYPNLDTLEDEGLIERGTLDRRTNEYALTDAGRGALRARSEWLSLQETQGCAVTDGGVSSASATHRIDTLLGESVDNADDPQVRERAREVLQLRDAEVRDR